MPRYRFEGFVETILTGLSHGVNAVLHRDGHGQPAGSTIVAQPGDEVTTAQPYGHAHLAVVDEHATPAGAPPPPPPAGPVNLVKADEPAADVAVGVATLAASASPEDIKAGLQAVADAGMAAEAASQVLTDTTDGGQPPAQTA